MYVYILSEKGYGEDVGDWYLYTVGFYDPSGKWQSDSDHSAKEEAAARVHYLNGGNVTETITNDDEAERDDEEAGKTDIEDCRECLCNTCTNIEKCIDAPTDWRGGVRPFPCAECADGEIYHMRGATCAGYVQGEENNE